MSKIFDSIKVTEQVKYQVDKRFESLLSENTEVVSSAESESSVYTNVRESHASEVTEQHQALDEGALEKITEDGNLDFLCVETDMGKPKCKIQCPYCERV